MSKKLILALVFLAPFSAMSSEVLDMSCGMSVRSFFAPLVQNKAISTKPFSVEQQSSINHFKPKFLKPLSVYGMRVTSVFGYTDDPLLFIKAGNAAQDVYGVIVSESIANVQAQLSSVGAANARTFRASAGSTIILCKGEM